MPPAAVAKFWGGGVMPPDAPGAPLRRLRTAFTALLLLTCAFAPQAAQAQVSITLNATAGNQQVKLTWTVANDDSSSIGVIGWQYQQKAGPAAYGDWQEISGSAARTRTHTVTGLTNGTVYKFKVIRKLAPPSGVPPQVLPESTEVTVTPIPPPGGPASLTAASGNRHVKLTFTKQSGDTVTKWQYRQWKDVGGSPVWGAWQDMTGSTGTTTSYAVRHLDNGAKYWFQVRAVNDAGNGAGSTSVFETPAAVAPVLTKAEMHGNGLYVRLEWTHPGGAWDNYAYIPRGQSTDNFGFTWLANYRLKGETQWHEWDNPSLASKADRTWVDMLPDQNSGYFSGAVMEVKVHVKADDTSGGNRGPDSNVRTVTYVNATRPLLDRSRDKMVIRPNTSQTYSVALNAAHPGRLLLSSADTSKATVSPAYLDFTASNYSTPRTVTVTAKAGASGDVNINHAFRWGASNTQAYPDVGAVAVKVSTSVALPPAKPTGFTAAPGSGQVTLNWDNPNDASITKWQYQRYGSAPPFGAWTDIPSSSATTTSWMQTSLTNGLVFGYRIRAVSLAGNGEGSDIRTVTPGALLAPTSVSATAGDRQVTLNWTAPVGTKTGYKYRYKKTAAGHYGAWSAKIGDDSTTSYTVSSLDNGAEYFFEVRAVSAGGDGMASAEVSATPNVPPAAPTVTASAGDGRVILSWSDPNDATITGWQVQQKTGGGSYGSWTAIPSATATTTRHTVTGLTNGTEYFFKVRAVNPAGNGAASKQVSATPNTVPAAPVVTATAGDARVTLSWADPGDASITRWEYRQKEGTAGTWSDWTTISGADATTTAHTVTGLTNRTTYFFEVRAVNSEGDGAPSVMVRSTPATTPAAPVVTVTGGDAQITLTWTDPNDASITSWEYRQKEGTAGTWSDWTAISGADATTTSHMVTGLTNRTTYVFQVRAVNAIGEGASSAAVSVTPAPAPAAPVVTATAGNAQVTLAWTDPNDASITGWEVRQKAGAAGTWGEWTAIAGSNATTTAHIVTGLTNGTEYFFEVRAVNGAGKGAAATAVSATPVYTGPTEAERADTVNTTVLPHVAAAMLSQTLAVVSGRIGAVATGQGVETSMTLGAAPTVLTEDRWAAAHERQDDRPAMHELLNGAAFNTPAGAAATGLAVWGRGERLSLSGSAGDVSWDGHVSGLHLGIDQSMRSDLLTGLALSYSRGKVQAQTTTGSTTVDSRHETSLTSLSPYVAWLVADGSHLWGSLSYGTGRVRITEVGSTTRTTDLTRYGLALGGEHVLRVDGTDRLAVKGEASASRLKGKQSAGLTALTVNTTRLRLALVGSREYPLRDERTLTPAVELGLRYDGGDIGAGTGGEVGARLTWRDPAAGLTAETGIRYLVTHARDRKEWGIDALVRLDPQADGAGTYLNVQSTRGITDSGLDALFTSDLSPQSDTAPGANALRSTAEVGYGFVLPGAGVSALLTPYAGVSAAGSGRRTWQFGTRYRLGRQLELGLEAQTRTDATAIDRLTLSGALYW